MEITIAFICLIVIGVLMLFKPEPDPKGLSYFRFRIWFPDQDYTYTEDYCMPDGPVVLFGRTIVLNLTVGVRPEMVHVLGDEPEKRVHNQATLIALVEAETDPLIKIAYAHGSGNSKLKAKYPLK